MENLDIVVLTFTIKCTHSEKIKTPHYKALKDLKTTVMDDDLNGS